MRRWRLDKRIAWIAIGLILLLLLVPAPGGLAPVGWRAIVLFLVVITMWITEVVPLPVAAIFALVLQPVMGVAPATQALSAFGTSAVFLILSGFLLGAGLIRSHLDKRIAYFAIRNSKNCTG